MFSGNKKLQFKVCVKVSAKHRMTNNWDILYFNDMDDIDSFDTKYPNYIRPERQNFTWCVLVKRQGIFRKVWKLIYQVTNKLNYLEIKFRNKQDCFNFISLIQEGKIWLNGNNVTCSEERVECLIQLYEPKTNNLPDFIDGKWCMFDLCGVEYIGRTYYSDETLVKMIGCVDIHGGISHINFDNLNIMNFKYLTHESRRVCI